MGPRDLHRSAVGLTLVQNSLSRWYAVEGSTEGGFTPRLPCATQLRYLRTWFTSSTRLASNLFH